MKVKNTIKTHLFQSFTFGSRHLHEDEDMGDSDVAPSKMEEQKKSHVSYYESQGHN